MLPALHSDRVPRVWQVTVLGVIASLPATAILNWLPDSEATVGGGVMIIGATIAGGLAVSRSVDPGAAGLRAGFLGGAIAVLAFVVTEAPTVTWSTPLLGFFAFAVGAVLCVSPLFGWGFGRIGGWVANRLSAH